MLRRALVAGAVASVTALGCVDSETVSDDDLVRTSVYVDPGQFLVDFPCLAADGAPQSYRATVFDLDTQADLGTSPRLGCGTPVAFEGVVVGSRYAARIEVFDQPAEFGVSAAWVTDCAIDGAGAAVAQQNERVLIRGCREIVGPGTALTSVTVDATRAITDSFACAEDGGAATTLRVTPTAPDDVALPEITLSCGQPAIVYGADIAAGTRYAFSVLALDEAGEVVAGTECAAVAREGIVMPTTCGAATHVGALRFPVREALAAATLACEDGDHVEAALELGPTAFGPQRGPCDADYVVAPVEPGAYLGTLTLAGAAGERARFACTGTATPGITAALVCTLED